MVSAMPSASCSLDDPLKKSLTGSALRPYFGGVAGIQEDAEGLIPWRLDPDLRRFYRSELCAGATKTAGVHLRFQTKATSLVLNYDLGIYSTDQSASFHSIPAEEFESDLAMDVFVNGTKVASRIFQTEGHSQLEVQDLPATEKEIVIYFPLHSMVRVRQLTLTGKGSRSSVPPRPRWITHGSSITHCRRAESPGFTWPAIVGREKGWDTWNLGFGGQCKFDPVVARVIAGMPADRISLCLGINTSQGFYNLQTWIPVVEGFIMTVRDGHPETPLLIISPILSPPREEFDAEPTTIGLRTMRRSLEEIVAKFVDSGDDNIYYLDGLQIIGPGDEKTMPDKLHPDAEGIKLMAKRFLERYPKAWLD